ncbi:hypothetical protein ES754_09540 [Psychrobacter frigidicola]|uniref:Uncharacterized protein n=1 Tax=Psychrobacter frigidicola TaxID=45611 RepID=A0A5C6ZZ83_9GAMM|nr:hypothetical protein [Psychrobacter frigidicola]TXD96385.1 hypothetical protein ES754_09540 [Psychrobacter frigidicola]
MQTSKDIQNLDNQSDTVGTKTATLTIDSLIEAQVAFMQQWLRTQAEPLAMGAWHWLGAQPMRNYVSCADLQHLLNDWLLSQPMSEVMRADIRDILHTTIYHPVNDNVPLSELVDDTQIDTLTTYIGSHEQQRNILIHSLIGNDTFADLLTQTLYHAINDFMETTLDKAGGVGKLMKLGRSSFEKATNRNLDEKLQAYLHRNIKDLTRRAETNAQEHLSNEEVTRLLITGWARIKDQPVSQLQKYLSDKPENNSIDHIEASVQQSFNRLRISPYLHSLVAAAVETWYNTHQSDSIATLALGLNVDTKAMEGLSTSLLPLAHDAIDSEWFTDHIREMLQAFYAQADIKNSLGFGIS